MPTIARACTSSPAHISAYLSLLASRSDSSKQRMSSSRTVRFLLDFGLNHAMSSYRVPGPLTLRMMERVVSSMNSTRTWVTPPREPVSYQNCSFSPKSHLFLYSRDRIPVRPRTLVTLTSLTGTLCCCESPFHFPTHFRELTWRNPSLSYVCLNLAV